ncbi:MAG: hypothetical protein ACLTYW_08015 [Collinsella sp.]
MLSCASVCAWSTSRLQPGPSVPYAELLNEQTEPVMRKLHERGVMCAIASSSYRELI